MRRVWVTLLLVVVACGDSAPETTAAGPGPYDRAAASYSASAMRALEGTAFDVLDEEDVAGILVGLCEGLGVGAIGVAAADTGIVAPDGDVAIFLEVLRTGLEQVCEEKVVVDYTAIYLRTVTGAITDARAEAAYDEIAVIRAAPIVCDELRSGAGADGAILSAVETMFGVSSPSVADLRIDAAQGVVAGAVLASATALLCPEHLDEIESFTGSS